MNTFWKWILGEDAAREGTPQLQWVGMPESWGVFVLLLAVALIAAFVYWLYTREIDTCPRPLKIFLATLRFTVLLFLVVLFLKPSVVFNQVNTIKPIISVMRDSSMSFTRKDQYTDTQESDQLAATSGLNSESLRGGGVSRAKLLQAVLEKDNGSLLKQLQAKGTLRISDFSEVVSTSGTLPAIDDNKPPSEEDESSTAEPTLPLLVANGRGTDMWQGLREQLSNPGRLSAIVLASDGQHNGSKDPIEQAYKAKDLGIPIFTIGVGDTARPRNLSVTKIYTRKKVPVNEPFEIDAALYIEDFDGDRVQVELIQHSAKNDAGEWEEGFVIESKDIEVPMEGGRVRASFQHTVQQPGTFAYSVRIAETEGESSITDNVSTPRVVTIADEKVKVLLIAGAPTWEYRMLQRLLQRDTNIVLSCWLQTMDNDRPQEGNAPISVLPNSYAELGEYNVVMMIDPKTEEFDEAWIGYLKDFCKKKAGGFFFMAGPKYTNMFVRMNKLAGIREILPVRFGDDEAIEIGQALASTSNTRPGKMLVVSHNLGHPIMAFVSDFDENLRLWNLMPSIYWSFPTLTAKPTALTLMERGDQINVEGNQPLLVAGRYGAGNVVYMGFNGTWRWRRVGLRAQYFDRFWIQVVNFLVETRSLQGKRRGLIETGKNEYELGEKITITGRILDERFEELTLPTVPAQIVTEDGSLVRTIDLKLLQGQEGQYEATFPPQNVGSFSVVVKLEGTDDESEIEPISYEVKPPSAESRAYWLDEKRLRDIAEASGGQYFALQDISQVADLVPQLETTTTYSSPPKPLWDINDKIRYLAFLLPFLLLTIEWAVRKKYKLL